MKTPRVAVFSHFIHLLMEDAPQGYRPWLFRCQQGSKAPAIDFGSWKDERNRLNPAAAIRWMQYKNGNVGIAGMPNDPLINVDIDDEETTRKSDLKPTLMARSRSRTGIHAWYFSSDDIPNIPTDNAGEVRAQGQYVIAPGSYVKTNPEEVPKSERHNAGYYTLEERQPVSWITYIYFGGCVFFSELPTVFREQWGKQQKQTERQPVDFNPKKANGSHSALYDIETADIVFREGGSTDPADRWTAIFHDSKTGMNMSMSNGLLHCWRHEVSHNALSALAVLSGYMTCMEAGYPHQGSGAGPSAVTGNDAAIWNAWRYAKEQGYIPKDDPIPIRAMKHIARKHDVYTGTDKWLPGWAYNKVIEIVEGEY